jgi:hypothetical protein
MARGPEGRTIFQDATDRRDFVARLAAVAAAGAWEVYAWALLPNRLHLLVRTGPHSLGRAMGALLAGYNRARPIVVLVLRPPPCVRLRPMSRGPRLDALLHFVRNLRFRPVIGDAP